MFSKHFIKTFFGFIGMITLGLIVLFFVGRYADKTNTAQVSNTVYR